MKRMLVAWTLTPLVAVALAGCSGGDSDGGGSAAKPTTGASALTTSGAASADGPAGTIVTSYGTTTVKDAVHVAAGGDQLFWTDAAGKVEQSAVGEGRALAPHPVPGLDGVKVVSLSATSAGDAWVAAAVDDKGQVYEWGRPVGVGLSEASLKDPAYTFPGAVPVPGVTGAKSVVLAATASFALTTDGQVYSWGDTTDYQILGRKAKAGFPMPPAKLPGLTGIKQIAVSQFAGYALRSDGTVLGWGSNNYSILAPGDYLFPDVPTPVPDIGQVTAIAAGGSNAYAAAVWPNGKVVAWGDGSNAALGDSTVEKAPLDKPVTLPGVTAPARLVTDTATYALSPDGKVTAWGSTLATAKGFDFGNNPTGAPVALTWLKGSVTDLAVADDFVAFVVRQ
ncbi:hypothetical protein SAMN05216251_12027 [Actinacidiphila alni]|uniref:Chromosome condensation regulator RCC1 n=1 Tax=Actinacidiphila alni TaxID=380248 RepID=A0A1I2JW47_9ACTN|nr:hypothetical protein [Actinacidiphila alni]SFF58343.1 hypothetical protein SAMN05216251_12027 [Actinacidiphila alni]